MIREVESQIARCEEEIHLIQSLPEDYPDRAVLVALWLRDWQAEKQILEVEASHG